MKDQQEIINKFVKLGRDWLNWQRSITGKRCIYEGEYSLYFGNNFTSFSFKWLDISYHDPAMIEIPVNKFIELDNLYKEALKAFKKIRKERSKKLSKEIKEERKIEIKALKNQLKFLTK